MVKYKIKVSFDLGAVSEEIQDFENKVNMLANVALDRDKNRLKLKVRCAIFTFLNAENKILPGGRRLLKTAIENAFPPEFEAKVESVRKIK